VTDRDDERWMRRALRLATLSLGRTWPNPGVGCVLVRDGQLLGQGRHAVYGQAHAEVNALTHCRALDLSPASATAYVTLAPCTRQGRQPPCVSALIGAGVARVVAAVADPDQDDPGPALRAAGIAYEVGCGAAVAVHLHGGFLHRVASGYPRFTGKWAMTLDGRIATATGDSAWISSPEALALARRRRRAFDGILVGSGTARHDDPRLLSAHPAERTPVRIVVSAKADLDPAAVLVATRDLAPVLLVHAPGAPAARLRALAERRVEFLAVAEPHDPRQVAEALGQRGFNEVLVEGGARIHGAWLRAGLYDRLEIYLGALALGGGLPVSVGDGLAAIAQAQRWQPEAPPLVFGDTVCLRLRRPGNPIAPDQVAVVGE
jgi:diaminohydroxyphosphoribosylaminopyrimidine deaminase/5-amino-6-(5-phosphoribosylamino)uracil reductase